MKSKTVTSEIFDMVYQWGRCNVVADETAPAFKKLIEKLLTHEHIWFDNTLDNTSICDECGIEYQDVNYEKKRG